MSVLPTFMYVNHMYAMPWRLAEGIGSRIGVMDDCEKPYGFCEQNLGPLQEQVILTPEPYP